MPRASSAQAIRAVLLASATATTFGRLRSSSRAAHALLALALPGEPQNRGRTDDQEAAEVSVALLADPDPTFGPATTMGLRRQPEPSGELATGSEQ